ncbi:hypothetical protein F3Y22_tig00110931pilonHSYRG00156 [Hibiscus syriacus]|uniref:Uncharacterized protein n=1 Tax=Hibiscus syriacus TaxID=106335 RepID=A0A6A2ZCU6_HIBSY|nr:uncharacterized protein LOC120146728 [Hibiscus syriacus]KAE8689831.1 hypothetical protein F3Y22_tig00110931pilonHSYRG00156 [Hibiscus syriacus]
MLNLTENPKLDSTSSNEISTQKISVSDHINGFQYSTDNKSDSFVLDLEGFSHGGSNKEINQNSRFTRSLSRKGSQRGGDKSSSCINSNWSSTAEKPVTAAVVSTDTTNNPQVHHQITITTGNITPATESRFNLQRNNSRRFSSPWYFDPKRILFIFATLSSMGTILLIYFTLSIYKTNGDRDAFD